MTSHVESWPADRKGFQSYVSSKETTYNPVPSTVDGRNLAPVEEHLCRLLVVSVGPPSPPPNSMLAFAAASKIKAL